MQQKWLRPKNRITFFGKLRDRLTKAATGDLVRITGRVRQTSYEAEGSIRSGMDLVADGFAILAKASGKPTEDDAGEYSPALAAARAAVTLSRCLLQARPQCRGSIGPVPSDRPSRAETHAVARMPPRHHRPR